MADAAEKPTPPAQDAAAATDASVEEQQPSADEPQADVEAPLPDDDILSRKVTLADLSAKGTALYAHKSYEEASEIFSEASNLQAEINGETAPENAEILFHYGRSLFKVGQSKSNVLGGPAAANTKASATKGKPSKGLKPATKTGKPEGEAAAAAANAAEPKDGTDTNKPLFQFTGDENFDESDSDDDEQGEGDEQDDEEDDLSVAFEILDLARVCYLKQLEQIQQQEQDDAGKGKEAAGADSPTLRHIKERLADTHDALAEISLENEKYPNAIEDGRTSLNYKLELYPEESEIIAEAHFKLSLALEFASVTTTGVAGSGEPTEDMDQGMRDEAVKEMEFALKSFGLKMQNKEVELATMASPEDNELSRKSIQEMKEVISDMEQRLTDLRNGPIDTEALLGEEANPLGGILGVAAGDKSETKARVEEAKKTAIDLTSLVRKRKPVAEAAAAGVTADDGAAAGGKRKADDEATGGESPKKAKVEDE